MKPQDKAKEVGQPQTAPMSEGWRKVKAGYAYAPGPGRAWNPLRDWPRNAKCFCGNGRKAKSCCLGRIEETVAVDEAAGLRKLVRQAQKEFA